MLILQNITYIHPNRDVLFDDLNLVINNQSKIALIGNNGVGKSTLLKIIAGDLLPAKGTIYTSTVPYVVPQHFGQYNHLSVAEALGIASKVGALKSILNGEATEENLAILDDDWTIEDRCQHALEKWALTEVDLFQPMQRLSGGQKTKVFLAGIELHRSEMVLLDEPSNHLDRAARKRLESFIETYTGTILMVSHDRRLLNLVDAVCELDKHGTTLYGGNYDFYKEQKNIQRQALHEDVKSKEKALKKAKAVERESMERQQKLDAGGKKKQEKAGMPTIMMNTLRNNAEKSTSRLKGVHADKIAALAHQLSDLRSNLPAIDKMKLGLDSSSLHEGKVLVTAEEIQFGYEETFLWNQPLSYQILSGDRVALEGLNGSGKSTLIQLILGQLNPQRGHMYRAPMRSVFIDQDYSLIQDANSVLQQAEHLNHLNLPEHEVKTRLNRFLFGKQYWDKMCGELSGGEKMRLMLCCLTLYDKAPDLLILDEPTNNLDIQNLEILTEAVNNYRGTVIVVSHDAYFLDEIGITKRIQLV